MAQPKLLLADDSLTIQKVVSLTFADRGIDVIAFSDGEAAVEHVDEVKPDIVLADVHMPGLGGYALCELVRTNESTRHIPVVLLVGSFEPFDRDEADRVGANTYLTKPFTAIADLVSTVDRLLAESATARPPEPPAVPLPDTTDIDFLYEQSFIETVELPRKDTVQFDVDVLDDEMIQTSYAEPDLNPAVGESLYAQAGHDEANFVEIEEIEAEFLIAESLRDATHDEQAADPGPEASPYEEPIDEPAPVYDPFESVAAEPPPARYEPVTESKTTDINLDDDLLEIPRASSSREIEYTVPDAPSANGREAVSLSPALVDMIVEKVLERLAEKESSDEARSVYG